eukprot:c13873_g2_i1 orf=313-570(+)
MCTQTTEFQLLYHVRFHVKLSDEVFSIFPCGKGALLPVFFPMVFNIASLCRGGTMLGAEGCRLPPWASPPLPPTAPNQVHGASPA